MVRKFINKIRDKISKITSSSPQKEVKKEQSWEERKKELLNNVRSKGKTPEAGEKKTGPHPKKENKPGKKPVRRKKPAAQKKNENRKSDEVESKKSDQVKKSGEVKSQQKKSSEWNSSVFAIQPEEGKTRFQDFDLPDEVMHAIYDLGFKYCTPIQSEILSKTLEGNDATGKAQTGTGKTAAFLITIFTRLLKNPLPKQSNGTPRVLIMAPTRELVLQIANDASALSKYTDVKVLTIFGGIDYQKQKRQLNTEAVDVVVATPGRLLDFYSKRDIDLRQVEILVIDEADRMLDMGFIPDMKKIIRATPHKDKRQTLLFSATLTPEIRYLASSWTKDAVFVDIEPEQIAGKNVEQICYIVSSEEKYPLLYNMIVQKNLNRVIVFTNRRDEAKKLKDLLFTHGINTAVLSGDVDQRKRLSTLNAFKEGKINILVATDIAGRGIHVEGVSHVVNFNLPEDPEDYVHRIGRTGRAGAEGTSISFACEDDSFQIPAIEKYLDKKLEFTHPPEELLTAPPPAVRDPEKENRPKPVQRKKTYKKNYRDRK